MNTPKEVTSEQFREKGSKFIGYLFPIESKEEFEKELEEIVGRYPDATHHCYAWRIDPHKPEEFSNDDGEPNGTAGLPILNQLKSYDAINCGIVVVRYFGGTKLGKSGLIVAYSETGRLCLEQASLLPIIPTQNYKITYPYRHQTTIDRLKNSFDLKEIEAIYLEDVTLQIACRSDQASSFFDRLRQLEHLGIEAEEIRDGYVTLNQ